jgi:hypothetical protein
MVVGLGKICKEAVMRWSRCYSSVCLEVLKLSFRVIRVPDEVRTKHAQDADREKRARSKLSDCLVYSLTLKMGAVPCFETLVNFT